jgi:hypothetical protein
MRSGGKVSPQRPRLRDLSRVCFVLALIAGCAMPPSAPMQPVAGVRYAFVVLGEDGQAVARAITSEAACPSIAFDGRAESMDIRALPALIARRPPRYGQGDAKPAAFPVLTCEKVIPAGVLRATIEGRALPLPKAAPQRIVVLGDTGCRLLAYGSTFQACNDPVAWPLRTVSDAAAAAAPDLVIHVGDYHYRENACPPGNAGCAGSAWGYGWDAWEADLFAPAQRLLAAAPWIVVRGNHETCARAGQGWWRFLDPRPVAARQNCEHPADDATGDYSEPYAVPLGTRAAADTQFIVFDSSVVGIAPLAAADPMYGNYRAQFEQAFALAARRPENFFLVHHPVLAFAANPGNAEAPYPGNAGLQSVLHTLSPNVLFPPNVRAVLSGHNHLFEVVSFATPQPAQFVLGNGGDWADLPLRTPQPAGVTPAPGAIVASMVALTAFGFTTMERTVAGWRFVARDTRGVPMTTCTLDGKKANCVAQGG